MHLVEHAPASGSLALWVRHADVGTEVALAHAAGHLPCYTDGLTVHYTPAFEALSLAQQAGWVAHEVLHIALRHAQRQRALARRLGEVDAALFNRCADAVVNTTLAHVGWLALPDDALLLEVLLDQVLEMHRSPEAALQEWDVERLYAAVDDRRQDGERRQDGPRAARARALGGSGTGDLRPAPADDEQVVDEAEQAREWGERLLRGHAGDGAFSILRALGADLPRVRTPWEQQLRTQVARALAPQPAVSWSRPTRSWLANQGRVRRAGAGPARRLPWTPGTSASRPVPRVVLVLDASGSIDAPLLDRFGAELAALQRRLGSALVLVVGDDAVRAVHRVAPREDVVALLRQHAPAAGGGTDFTPLLEEAARHAPDLTVVLTDLDGPTRCPPPGPTLWAVPPGCAAAQPPFGRLLVLR